MTFVVSASVSSDLKALYKSVIIIIIIIIIILFIRLYSPLSYGSNPANSQTE